MSDTNPTILAMSSTVAVGHVGLSAIVPTLHLIGRTTAAIPTITLSNHPGFTHVGGIRTPPETIHAIADALKQNSFLTGIDTILTGYLPSEQHVDAAHAIVTRIRGLNPAARYICDPILGDDPKGLYIDRLAAHAIHNRLIPLANCILPNRFELSWLADMPVDTPDDARKAVDTLRSAHNHNPQIIAKSIPIDANQICNIDFSNGAATATSFPCLDDVPNGTGDMLSGLIAAGWSLARATAALTSVVEASLGQDHLAIIANANRWRTAAPQPTFPA